MTTAQAAPEEQDARPGTGTSCRAAIRTTLPPALGTLRSIWPWSLLKAKTAMTTTMRLDEDRPDRPPGHGLLGVLGGLGAVELLVHALDAQEQEHGREEVPDGLEPGMGPELAVDHGEVARVEGCLGRRQAAGGADDEGHGQQAGQDDDDPVRAGRCRRWPPCRRAAVKRMTKAAAISVPGRTRRSCRR